MLSSGSYLAILKPQYHQMTAFVSTFTIRLGLSIIASFLPAVNAIASFLPAFDNIARSQVAVDAIASFLLAFDNIACRQVAVNAIALFLPAVDATDAMAGI